MFKKFIKCYIQGQLVDTPQRVSDSAEVASEIGASDITHAPVHIKFEEKLSVSVSRDGGLESGEVYPNLLHKNFFRKRTFL